MKRRLILNFPPESSDKPITYHLIKDYDFIVNILRAEITAGKEGRLLIEIESEENNLKRGLEYLKRENVTVHPLGAEISVNEDECIHCGICSSVCFSGAIDIDREKWQLLFNPESCIACELCIEACPLGLIELHFVEDLISEGV